MRADVLYATTDDGLRLPIIDVTHPAFAVTATDAELAAMSDQFVLESKQRQEVSAPLREALQRSMLGRGLMAAAGTFLTGMDTYLLKLGPDNLGANADPLDRRIAGSFPALTTRLRLQDMARLLADRLSRTIAARPRQPVCLINIAGGPGADSWNALIRLHAEHPAVLAGRKIQIALLDLDDRGPAFGARAFATLRAPGAPLSGLDIGFRHVPYEWSDTDRLRQALDDLHATDAVCAISTEAGLFEYGSDREIVANLETLRIGTAPDTGVVGSVTRDGEPARLSQIASRVTTRPRTLEAFRDLVERAGWIVPHVIERPFSYNVCLGRAASRTPLG
jgi:hypothetical protein